MLRPWTLGVVLPLLLPSLLLVGCDGTSAQPDDDSSAAGGSKPVAPPRRVVGYIPTYRSMAPEAFDFSVLTHLCIAFANPTGEGSESDFEESARAKIAPLVTAAHAHGVKVLASIAGGTKASGEIVGAQIIPENVDAYIAGLLDLLDRYDLDGIDVDIEGAAVTETYEPFVKKLNAALPAGKLMTAAVATKNGDPVSKAALDEYDFINVMAYDHCSWSDTPCDQSSMEGTMEDLKYWTEKRGYPIDKTVLGVPFYGWCWGCSEMQSAMTYAQIVQQYPQAKEENWIREGEVEISLNSALTIATKTQLAMQYGGIMVWELGQDARGEDSLFAVIAREVAQPRP